MDAMIEILRKHCTCGYHGKCPTCQYVIEEEESEIRKRIEDDIEYLPTCQRPVKEEHAKAKPRDNH